MVSRSPRSTSAPRGAGPPSLDAGVAFALRRGGEGGPGPEVRERAGPAASQAGGTVRIVCADCRYVLAERAAPVVVSGRHVHERENPHGFSFRFGCFAGAPGTRLVGAPELAHSWFPGLPWQIALCGGCGVHVGWRWAGGAQRFFGLVLDRVEIEAGEPDA